MCLGSAWPLVGLVLKSTNDIPQAGTDSIATGVLGFRVPSATWARVEFLPGDALLTPNLLVMAQDDPVRLRAYLLRSSGHMGGSQCSE